MAKGSLAIGGLHPKSLSAKKVAVAFGQTLMDAINAKAEAEGTSFAEAVRRICRVHFERQ